jgi:hypothetical protein
MSYSEQVADDLASRLGWTQEEARNVVGDVSEYEAEGLTITEAARTVIDALTASA